MTDLIPRDTKVGTSKLVRSELVLSQKSIPWTDHLPPLSLPPSVLVVGWLVEGVAVVVLGLDLVAVLVFTRGTDCHDINQFRPRLAGVVVQDLNWDSRGLQRFILVTHAPTNRLDTIFILGTWGGDCGELAPHKDMDRVNR